MEIPDKVLTALLDSMARSHLDDEDNLQIERDLSHGLNGKPKLEAVSPAIKKPVRRFKSNPTTLGTATALFSKEGKYRAMIQPIFNDIDDGNYYRVDVTGRCFTSHRMAINNARKWLKKKRLRYYKKHPKEKPRIKTVRLIPKETKNKIKLIQKLYIMDKDVAKILFRMSNRKLKVHEDYSRKKFDNNKTTAVSGSTSDFNTAIYTVMIDGTKKERKLVAKMLKKFTHEPFRKTNMFY